MGKLRKKLETLDSMTINRFYIGTLLRKNMDSIEVIEKEWADDWRNERLELHPLDLSLMETWSTFEGCTRTTFKPLNTKFITCDIELYDGGTSFSSSRGRGCLEWTAKLKIPVSFLKNIENEIDNLFDTHCDREYNKYLEKQKEEWIKKYEKGVYLG